jgi:TolB-like protein/tetratricopeptide (TPR) repeat protein
LQQLFRELKRRNVYRVAATYAAVAFMTLQAARLVFPATTLEGLYDKLVVLAFVGFPIALVIAWAFELTPEGVRRTAAAEGPLGSRGATQNGEDEAPPPTSGADGGESRLAIRALVGLGTLAAAVAGGWYLVGAGGGPSSRAANPADSARFAPRAGDRSIAVLPFEALSAGERSTTFARGIHDDLLTRLAHVSGLTVISRTAVKQYRDTELTTGAIADSLGVRWVMEGGVQVLGDQIQVNAQLIDPRTEAHTWADSYRRALTARDLFALQGEITKRIARSLETELTPEEARQVERQPTGDLEAYRLYVKGRDRLDTRTEAGMWDAVDYFQRAIQKDSTYALAWTGLADAVGLFAAKEYATPEGSLPDHQATARRALELAPDLAEAHASMGFVYMGRLNGPAALRELERAVELKPGYAQAHHWLGLLLLHFGRLPEAHDHVSLAVELNPGHQAARGVLFAVLLARGEVDEARTHLGKQSREDRRLQDLRSFVLYHARAWDELEELVGQVRETEGEGVLGRFYLARIAALRGDTAAARDYLSEIRREEASNVRYVFQGLTHAALGQTDRAFAAWDELELPAAASGLPEWVLRYWFPDLLDPLRDDPRYRKLMGRFNRAWGLNPDGSLPDSVDVSFGPEATADS